MHSHNAYHVGITCTKRTQLVCSVAKDSQCTVWQYTWNIEHFFSRHTVLHTSVHSQSPLYLTLWLIHLEDCPALLLTNMFRHLGYGRTQLCILALSSSVVEPPICQSKCPPITAWHDTHWLPCKKRLSIMSLVLFRPLYLSYKSHFLLESKKNKKNYIMARGSCCVGWDGMLSDCCSAGSCRWLAQWNWGVPAQNGVQCNSVKHCGHGWWSIKTKHSYTFSTMLSLVLRQPVMQFECICFFVL